MNGARQVQVGRQETHAQRSPTVIEGCGALGSGRIWGDVGARGRAGHEEDPCRHGVFAYTGEGLLEGHLEVPGLGHTHAEGLREVGDAEAVD